MVMAWDIRWCPCICNVCITITGLHSEVLWKGLGPGMSPPEGMGLVCPCPVDCNGIRQAWATNNPLNTSVEREWERRREKEKSLWMSLSYYEKQTCIIIMVPCLIICACGYILYRVTLRGDVCNFYFLISNYGDLQTTDMREKDKMKALRTMS